MGSDVGKGYRAEDFSDALARYIPEAEVKTRVQELEQYWKLWEQADAGEAEEEEPESNAA